METHPIHPELLERQVRVLVVGCGGNEVLCPTHSILATMQIADSSSSVSH
jgi:hypothetical protein